MSVAVAADAKELYGPSVAIDASVEPGQFGLRLLGSFELLSRKTAVAVPLPAQRVAAFIAVEDRPVLRGKVAGTLWPESSEERASANLRTALWHLNKAHPGVVETSSTLRLAPTVHVDVREATLLAQRLLNGGGDPSDDEAHIEALSSDLLPDWYDDWILFERERFRQARLHALEALSERLAAAGRFAAAVQAALAAVAVEPLRESSQRALLRAHLAEGNVVEAIRQYGFYRRMLKDEIGAEPSRLLQELVAGSGVG